MKLVKGKDIYSTDLRFLSIVFLSFRRTNCKQICLQRPITKGESWNESAGGIATLILITILASNVDNGAKQLMTI